ncbi:hypothetical protein B0H17DRAFT_1212339 [Mycena rosella]|uniref:Uncharacterized protein n=1 Tax=Mycena rosella TaxID=1033263 RepID=A0AAD7CSA8_MYCRO|nr:hypothetical protein B0H17DRAFT_1212339 [Mycena rosella]
MFFTAWIALASIPSLSTFTVNSAPVTVRDIVPQFCTLPLGGGVCTPLNGTECTNTPGIQSLLLNTDADCAAFPSPDCTFAGSGKPVLEQFSDDSQHLEGKGIQSVQCFENVGTANGFTIGSEADLETQAIDAAAGASPADIAQEAASAKSA